MGVNLNPTKGHEQRDTRPAVVLSPKSYNARSSLLLACPMITKVKGYPFETVFTFEGKTAAILVDQIKSLDWRARDIRREGSVDPQVLQEVWLKLAVLLRPAS